MVPHDAALVVEEHRRTRVPRLHRPVRQSRNVRIAGPGERHPRGAHLRGQGPGFGRPGQIEQPGLGVIDVVKHKAHLKRVRRLQLAAHVPVEPVEPGRGAALGGLPPGELA